MLKIKKKHVVYLVFIFIVLGSLLIGLYSYNWTIEGLDVTTKDIYIKYSLPSDYYEVSRDISKGTKTISPLTVANTVDLPHGYYVASSDLVGGTKTFAKIPYGYIIDPKNSNSIVANTHHEIYSTTANTSIGASPGQSNNIPANTRYNSDNLNTQYHAVVDPSMSVADTLAQTGTWVIKDGKKVMVPWSDVTSSITYYTPGSYPFGPSNYVPNYEDSVYLSRTTGMSSAREIEDPESGGFCSKYKDNPNKIDEFCKMVDTTKCGLTSCCVSLGNEKCVAGDKNGPSVTANYSDIYIKNKDFYYYQGKCHGNCV